MAQKKVPPDELLKVLPRIEKIQKSKLTSDPLPSKRKKKKRPWKRVRPSTE